MFWVLINMRNVTKVDVRHWNRIRLQVCIIWLGKSIFATVNNYKLCIPNIQWRKARFMKWYITKSRLKFCQNFSLSLEACLLAIAFPENSCFWKVFSYFKANCEICYYNVTQNGEIFNELYVDLREEHQQRLN